MVMANYRSICNARELVRSVSDTAIPSHKILSEVEYESMCQLVREERQFRLAVAGRKVTYNPFSIHERGKVMEIRMEGHPVVYLDATEDSLFIKSFLGRRHVSVYRHMWVLYNELGNLFKEAFHNLVYYDYYRNVSLEYSLYRIGNEQNESYTLARKLAGVLLREYGSQLDTWISKYQTEGTRSLSTILKKWHSSRYGFNPDGAADFSDPYVVSDLRKYTGLRSYYQYYKDRITRHWPKELPMCEYKTVRKLLTSGIPIGHNITYLKRNICEVAEKHNVEPWRFRYMLSACREFDREGMYNHHDRFTDNLLRLLAVSPRADIMALRRPTPEYIDTWSRTMETVKGLEKSEDSSQRALARRMKKEDPCRPLLKHFKARIKDLLHLSTLYDQLVDVGIAVKQLSSLAKVKEYDKYIHEMWRLHSRSVRSRKAEAVKAQYSNMELSLPGIEPPAGVKLLKTADELYTYGTKQGHCLGSLGYYEAGVQGKSYFVHLEREEDGGATAQVSSKGRIMQVNGRFNKQNESTRLLHAILLGWAQEIGELSKAYSKYSKSTEE